MWKRGTLIMVDNAENYFNHTDADGDSVELVAFPRDRMTLRVLSNGYRPLSVYLTADAVDELIDGLNRWRGRNKAASVEPEKPVPTAEQLRDALHASVAFGCDSEEGILDRADAFAYWLATGERQPEPAVSVTPTPDALDDLIRSSRRVVDLLPADRNMIDGHQIAEAALRKCAVCAHAYHGRVGCGHPIYGSGVTQIRCSCAGAAA
jgi:hypothetical protein